MSNQEYIAARIALGIVNAYDIQDDINGLINEGVYYSEFIKIIDSHPPTLIDVLSPYKKFLNRLNVSIPSPAKAILIIFDYHTKMIVDNDIDPLQGFENLSTAFEYIRHSSIKKNYCNELCLGPLMSIYDELDYSPYSRFNITMKTRIVKEAKIWRKKCLHE